MPRYENIRVLQMDINKIIDNSIKNTQNNKINAVGEEEEKQNIKELLNSEILTDEILNYAFEFFKADIEKYVSLFLETSEDSNADKGMYKCSLETWQACISNIGREYFQKNRYLYDENKRKAQGGNPYRDELLTVGLMLYEYFCRLYRKQFFIYDCCQFMGMSLDTMFKLNTIHAELLKKAHATQEASMRTALASGRSNVTAMAILLNHDYDYTRTTQIVHTTDRIKQAEELPTLNNDMCKLTDTNLSDM